MKEKLSRPNGTYPRVCFQCPARVFSDGEYYCDPTRLDDRTLSLRVARYKPGNCPHDPGGSGSTPPEILLRKMLGK